MTDNPLLAPGDLPAFDRIRADHVVPAVEAALAHHETAMTAIRAADPSFEAVVLAKVRADAKFDTVWSAVGHLKGVMDTPELRAAYEAVNPKVLAYMARVGQDRALYAAMESLQPSLKGSRRRLVDLALRDFRLSGVALAEPARARFSPPFRSKRARSPTPLPTPCSTPPTAGRWRSLTRRGWPGCRKPKKASSRLRRGKRGWMDGASPWTLRACERS